MKKVVILGSAHPFRGGLASYNERLAKALQDSGCEVTIETFTTQYPSVLFPGKSQFSDSPAPLNLKITRSVSSINPLTWISVGRKIRKQAPDLLIIKYWMPFMAPCFGTIARIVKGNGKTKVLSIVDNIIPHEKRTGDKQLSNYFVSSVDGFIAMSASVLKDINLFDNSKPKLFSPHPLFDNFGTKILRGHALQKLGLSADFRYILFFGFIRHYKGLDLLLKAFADDRLKGLPVKLIIAGEYYVDSKPYEEIISDANIGDRIIQHNNFISDEKVAEYFCAADIVVQPYKDATQSGVTQIAYHFDKPMLVTNVGGLAEIIPDGKVGYVVEPDPVLIANSLYDFYSKNREAEFVKNANTEKLKYSWQRMVDSIKEIYLKMLNSK